MLRKLESKDMGRSDLGWLKSIFHFSFADYYQPDNINFGVLRVVNDDLIAPNRGFELHPHRDMEIISYVIDGQLTHGDTIGNKNTISRGHVQYMSAGTGISHSEHNLGQSVARFLQIWIFPDEKGLTPNYGDYRFKWEDRKNKWLKVVSGSDGDGPIKINQDVNIYAIELDQDKEIDFKLADDRQAYLIQIEGQSEINQIALSDRDALEIVAEDIKLKAIETAHIIVIEMKKE